MWSEGTASYLRMIVPRLVLMRELLMENGSIYVHLDWHVGHYVKIVLDDIFDKDLLRREIIWDRGNPSGGKAGAQNWIHSHDNILYYTKSTDRYFDKKYDPYQPEERRVGKGCDSRCRYRWSQ